MIELYCSLFSSNPLGFVTLEISLVAVSANMFRTNSVVLMLSRKLSFFSPLYVLYCLVVMPLQAFVISSVKTAYSLTPDTPLSFHSLSTNLCQPKFKWFRFLRWNGLNHTKNLFCVGYISKTFFPSAAFIFNRLQFVTVSFPSFFIRCFVTFQ